MTRRRRLVHLAAALCCAAAAIVAVAAPASAHALPIHEVPAENTTVATSPPEVEIVFGETPDPSVSAINVINTSGTAVTSGPSHVVAGNPEELEVPLKPHLPRGVYTVQWHTLSAVDGHFVGGTYAFGVGVAVDSPPTSTGASSPNALPSAETVIARLLLYLGLMAAVGAAVADLVVFRQRLRSASWLAGVGAVTGVIGAVGIIDGARRTAGIAWSALASTTLDHSLVVRSVAALLLLVGALLTIFTSGSARRFAIGATGILAGAGMLVDVLFSHAAAESPEWLNVTVQWLHIAGAGVWIGGLGALLLGLREVAASARGAAARRFSFIAGFALVIVGGSGLWRAFVEIGSWGAVLTTAFGIIVVIKSALLLLLAGLGAINRWRNVPRAESHWRGLRVVGSTEMILACAAILAASALVNLAPPADSAALSTATTNCSIRASDDATTVRLALQVAPCTTGVDTFSATVTDYDSGAPVDASSLQLTFSLPTQPLVGNSLPLTLARTSPGHYSGTGADLALAGTWRVQALVVNGSSSTEVNFNITPHVTPPVVTEIPDPGGPTLYSIALAGGETAEAYLDPVAGQAHHYLFHVTFFAAGGNSQLPVTTAAIIEVPAGGAAITLSPQLLTPGHFVTPATVTAGKTRFEIFGSTAAGDEIATYLDVTTP